MTTPLAANYPRGCIEAEQKREAHDLLWALTDRLRARYEGSGLYAQMSYAHFVADVLTTLAEVERLSGRQG